MNECRNVFTDWKVGVLIIFFFLFSSPLLAAGVEKNSFEPPGNCSMPEVNSELPKGQSKKTTTCPPIRNIVFYDTVITGTITPVAGAELQFAGDGIADILISNSDRDRFVFLDSGVLQAKGGAFKTGNNYAPAGAVNAGDYLILSEITQTGKGFRLRLWIETSVSREIVKESLVEFADAHQALSIAKSAAQTYLTPLNEIIDNFEKQKRENDPNIAIGAANIPDSITFSPGHASLEPGETIDVTIMVKDCDSIPLRGRKLKLSVSGGTLDKTTVTTDNNGNAKVRYTAGTGKNAGTITAVLEHKTPPGHSNQAGNAINVKIQLAELWLMQVSYIGSSDETGFAGIDSNGEGEGSMIKTMNSWFSFAGILERQKEPKGHEGKGFSLFAPGFLHNEPNDKNQWGTFSYNSLYIEDLGHPDSYHREEVSLSGDINSMQDGSLGIEPKEQYLSFSYINNPKQKVLFLHAAWPFVIIQNGKTGGFVGGGDYWPNRSIQLPLTEFRQAPGNYFMVFRKNVVKGKNKTTIEAVVTLKNLNGNCTH